MTDKEYNDKVKNIKEATSLLYIQEEEEYNEDGDLKEETVTQLLLVTFLDYKDHSGRIEIETINGEDQLIHEDFVIATFGESGELTWHNEKLRVEV